MSLRLLFDEHHSMEVFRGLGYQFFIPQTTLQAVGRQSELGMSDRTMALLGSDFKSNGQ